MPSIFQLEGHRLPQTSSRPVGLAGVSRGTLALAVTGFAIASAIAWRLLKRKTRGLRGVSMVSMIARESKTADEYARRIEAWNAGEAKPLPVAKLARGYRKASPSTVARLIREAHEQRVEGRERLWSKMSRGLRGLRQTPGGKAHGMKPSDFNRKDLDAGTRVELEHTSDPAIARKIAMDHLVEDRAYYRKLKQVHLDGVRSARLGAIDVTQKQQRMFKRGVDAMRRAMKGTSDPERAFDVAIRGSKDSDFATGVRTAFNLVSSKGNREAAQTNLVKYGFKQG
jgi:hypothetical protein